MVWSLFHVEVGFVLCRQKKEGLFSNIIELEMKIFLDYCTQ